MITTTTHQIEGHTITKYHFIVAGETIIGANFIKDFFASITDFLGGRSNTYEQVLREAKETAIKEMEARAYAMGANAVVGVSLNYETIGQRQSMLMVTATGTAVTITPKY